MPLNWLDFHELCIDWSFEKIQFLVVCINVRQKLARFANIIDYFVPNHIISRILDDERLHPSVLASSCDDASEITIASKVELEKILFEIYGQINLIENSLHTISLTIMNSFMLSDKGIQPRFEFSFMISSGLRSIFDLTEPASRMELNAI